MKDLEPALKEQVVELCNKALEAQEEERYHASNRDLQKVYELLPEPKEEWKAYIWLQSNRADNHFEQDEYEQAATLFNEVFERDSSSNENAYLCLRCGQCALELEHEGLAAELLGKALKLEGKELFEDEHSKYLKLAKQATE
jgi:tetratricopeptide (TPR) repeat protein